MLPDSTVRDPKKPRKKRKSADTDGVPTKKTKKRADVSTKKPIKKKVKKKLDDEDYGSDLELSKDLQPISHYMKDRRELVHQMFASLKKTKIKSMLPEILKKYSLKEMEEFCCDQIAIMSKKRITALIKGRKPDEISSSGTEDDYSSDSDDIVTIEKVEITPPDSTGVTAELPSIEEEIEKVKPHSIAVAMGTHRQPINKQKLEILELEMRARAIKKMLQSQQRDEDEVAYSDADIEKVASRDPRRSLAVAASKMDETEYDQPQPSTSSQLDDDTDSICSSNQEYNVGEGMADYQYSGSIKQAEPAENNQRVANRTEHSASAPPKQAKKKTVKKDRVSPREMEPGELSDDDEESEREEGEEAIKDNLDKVDYVNNAIDNDVDNHSLSDQSTTDLSDDASAADLADIGNIEGEILQALQNTGSEGIVTDKQLVNRTDLSERSVLVQGTNEFEEDATFQSDKHFNDNLRQVSTGEDNSTEISVSPNAESEDIIMEKLVTQQQNRMNKKEKESKAQQRGSAERDLKSSVNQSSEDGGLSDNRMSNSAVDVSISTSVQEDVEDDNRCKEQRSANNDTAGHNDGIHEVEASNIVEKFAVDFSKMTGIATEKQAPEMEKQEEPVKYEDIFVVESESGEQTSLHDNKPGKAMDASVGLSLADVDDTNSALYEDIPSPGKSNELTQLADTSNDEHTVAGPINMQDETSPRQSTEIPKRTTCLNWSANLDVNLDELAEEIMAGDKEESRDETTDLQAFDGQSVLDRSNADPLDNIVSNRAQTPEITAQRYRSRNVDVSSSDSERNIHEVTESRKGDPRLSTTTVEENKTKPPERSEPKTKVHSSASTAAVKPTKEHKTKKSKKSDGKRARQSTHKETDDKKSSKTKGKISESTKKIAHSKARSTGKSKHETDASKATRKTPENISPVGRRSVESDNKTREKSKSKARNSPPTHETSGGKIQENSRHEAKEPLKEFSKRTSVFERLSKTDTSSHKSHIPSQRKDSPPPPHRRKHSSESTSRSPHRRISSPRTSYPSARRRTNSPIYHNKSGRDSHRTYDYHTSHEKEQRHHKESDSLKHSSHDDRSRRTYKTNTNINDRHVSPKRFRAEWDMASKVISLGSKSTVVKTYDRVPGDLQRKVTGTRRRPMTLADSDDKGPKSPVRFPSPDIQVVNIHKDKTTKPPPLVVVLSDSN